MLANTVPLIDTTLDRPVKLAEVVAVATTLRVTDDDEVATAVPLTDAEAVCVTVRLATTLPVTLTLPVTVACTLGDMVPHELCSGATVIVHWPLTSSNWPPSGHTAYEPESTQDCLFTHSQYDVA
jgi:hypothetical protein